MKSALKTLMAAYESPHQAVLEHRSDQSPVFGYLTEHVPLELIHAAGIMPVRIQSGDAAGMASGHLQTFSCSFCRTAIHQETGGEYHYLSGLVSSKTCDTALSLFQIWTYRRPMDFSWLLSLPGNNDEGAVDYFAEELLALKRALEAYCHGEIREEKVAEAMVLYDDIRIMAERIWERSRKGVSALSAKEIVGALKGCQVLPPQTSLDLLKALVEEDENMRETPDLGIPLMLLGGTFRDISLLDVIEKGGGRIMVDDTVSGGRAFGGPIKDLGDPIRSLARHYLSKITGPYRLPYEVRKERVLELARRYGVRGCIHVVQMFCDTSLFEIPLMVEDLKTAGIPSLVLEVDDTVHNLGQATTRIEAFLEMLKGDF